MKVIIAGSREVPAPLALELVERETARFLSKGHQISEVVSGGARGVDQAGERWARAQGISVNPFPYRQDLGKRGGPVRNTAMAKYADALILISAGTRGSTDMLAKARSEQRRRAFVIQVLDLDPLTFGLGLTKT